MLWERKSVCQSPHAYISLAVQCGRSLKRGTHWRQRWIQHARLRRKLTKSTMLLWRQSRKDVRHSGDRVDHIGDRVDGAGDMLTATSCGIQVVADFSSKLATKSTVSATKSNLSVTVDFVADFGNSRLHVASVPGFKDLATWHPDSNDSTLIQRIRNFTQWHHVTLW